MQIPGIEQLKTLLEIPATNGFAALARNRDSTFAIIDSGGAEREALWRMLCATWEIEHGAAYYTATGKDYGIRFGTRSNPAKRAQKTFARLKLLPEAGLVVSSRVALGDGVDAPVFAAGGGLSDDFKTVIDHIRAEQPRHAIPALARAYDHAAVMAATQGRRPETFPQV